MKQNTKEILRELCEVRGFHYPTTLVQGSDRSWSVARATIRTPQEAMQRIDDQVAMEMEPMLKRLGLLKGGGA